ncbi:MAG: DUF2169 domain-containing protein [Polyangiaceae bacterium]
MGSVRFVHVAGCDAGFRPWRVGDRHFVTIAVKTEVSFAASPPVARASTLRESDLRAPDGSLSDASDLGLYLGRGELLFFGSLKGAPLTEAHGRLALVDVVTGAALVDKRVVGILPFASGPLTSVRLDYANSRGRPEDRFNPIGRPDAPIVHGGAPHFPAATGPVAPAWPARAGLLRDGDPACLAEPEPHVTQGFNFNYFHAAPTDQRAPRYFEGREAILLEGLSPSGAPVDWRLPSLRAEAVRLGPDGDLEPVPLLADLLRVFGDEARATLTWRATVPLARADEEVVVGAVVTTHGQAVDWEAMGFASTEACDPEPPLSSRTRVESRSVLGSMTLPFLAVPSVSPRPSPSPSEVPGAPWSAALPDIPPASAAVAGTALSGVNLADLAAQALARRAASPDVRPSPVAVPVAPAPPKEERVLSVKLRDTPGSRYLLLMVSRFKKRSAK